MTLKQFFDTAGISILLCLSSVYFAVRTWMTRDPSVFRARNARPLKHNDEFCREACKAMIFFGIVSLGHGIVSFFDPISGILFLITGILITALLFQRANRLYGETK